MDKKETSKKNDNKDTDSKKVKSPVENAIDDYLENTDYNEVLQSLQPLRVIPDKLDIDPKTKRYRKPSNEKIINAFYRWRGIKSSIAIELRCSRPTLNAWIDKDVELQEAYNDSCEYALDHAESKLNELIDGVLVQDYDFSGKPVVYRKPPEIKAIANLLMTKGKHRGYTTKTETELSGKTEQIISFKES